MAKFDIVGEGRAENVRAERDQANDKPERPILFRQ
jgi:hypothetical protein